MHDFEVVLVALLISVALLSAIATRLRVPYPIVLVVGGAVLALLPGLPDVVMEPDLVLLVFLPPLLYVAAIFSDVAAIRADARALSMTAIGLVMCTVLAVAAVGRFALDLTWPMAFALGAVVAPTDPVAATAIMRRLGVSRRIVTLVEGESLVNDASALITYRVAVAAAVAGGFSLVTAGWQFVLSTVGGVAVGLAVGALSAAVRRRLDDPPTEITISVATGYVAFLPAEWLGLSGVLAAVSAGLFLSRRASSLASPTLRLEVVAMWGAVTFLLNAALFVLIGLQLPVVAEGVDAATLLRWAGYAGVVYVAVVATRFVWLFTTPYLIRAIDRRPTQRARRMGAAERTVVGWSGLRGAVTLAAALALPLATDDGDPLPGRSLVVFVAFWVVLASVVGQGLTLPLLVRRLRLPGDDVEEREERTAWRSATDAALVELDQAVADGDVPVSIVDQQRAELEHRRAKLAVEPGTPKASKVQAWKSSAHDLQRRLLDAQRRAIVELRDGGEISSDVLRRVEHQLDLAESQLDGHDHRT